MRTRRNFHPPQPLQKLNKNDIGLYRDDGLMILRNTSGRQADKVRQLITKIFKLVGFDIEIMINLKVVDFLDLTLNLDTGFHKPYRKPNDHLQYIHTSSNHPKNILDQLPKSIN